MVPQVTAVDPGPGETTIIVRRVQSGEDGAKEDLYSRLREPLLRRIRTHRHFKRLSRRMTEEDLLNDVIERCESARSFDTFEATERGCVRRFLDKVVHSTLVDAVRRQLSGKRGGGWSEFGGTDEAWDPIRSIPATDTTPTSAARYRELVAQVRRTLNSREWDAWKRRRIDGLEVEEIASRDGTTRKAIWSLIHRADGKIYAALSSDYSEWLPAL